ncbi:MAG: hypothetical protein CMM67_10660 [Rhodospirillaceae bacterium]|nr:hypothetical protein [Rhodospirillaceae bacterium]OUT76532.1 MAG: hypothetical protein CBB83_10840 [Rhodospirillaceae bacterium TMED23]|tara:strand:- start:1647 stop:2540 length:894 start_codon:yes stop_codon:yes gene_type:complete
MIINIELNNLKPHLWGMLSDTIDFVRIALEECGIKVKVGVNQLKPDILNLFFDHFDTNPSLPLKMKILKIKYGLVCTEVLSVDGIWNSGAEGRTKSSVVNFQIAAENAEFVWCLFEESVEACRKFNPNTIFLPIGFLERLKPNYNLRNKEDLDIDFLMCGVPTAHRKGVTDALKSRGHNVSYFNQPIPVYLRNSLMQRSQINLSIQKTCRHRIISMTRICHSVINRIPVLLEYSGPANIYSDLCLVAGSDEFVDKAEFFLNEIDLFDLANEKYKYLEKHLPMKSIMKEVINRTWKQG